jgi:hypothetical protein
MTIVVMAFLGRWYKVNKVTALDLYEISELIGKLPVNNPFANLPESQLRDALEVIYDYQEAAIQSLQE